MTDRILHYYQMPVAPGFDEHMIRETGLNAEQQKMARNLRTYYGDTEFFAGLADLPLKRYNASIAAVHQRLVGELFRLAQIGWETEQNTKR